MALGDTDTEPPDTGVAGPTPLSMEAVVAFVLVHDSVDEPPADIVAGEAEKVPVGGGGAVTVTVAG